MANPWDNPTVKQANPGLINSVANAGAGTYSGTGYNAAQSSAAGYNATTGTASSYNPNQTTVNAATDTVQGQIKGIIDSGSPLMTMAETKAKQSMNKTGILNSSMAVGAGQAALYNAALPIAQQDATTYSTVNRENTAAKNTADQFNAGNSQQMSLANMDAKNTSSQFNAGNQQQTNLANQNATNTAGQFNANATNQANSQNAQAITQVNLANADASNKVNAQNAANIQQANQFNASQSNDLTKLGMDIESKQSLANIEASYKVLMQGNQSASEIYKQSVKNISDIMSNKDMNQAAKDAAVANQVAMLKKGMEITGGMSNLNLDQYLNFEAAGIVGGNPGSVAQTAKAVADARLPVSEQEWGQNRLIPGYGYSSAAAEFDRYAASGGGFNKTDWYNQVFKQRMVPNEWSGIADNGA